MNETDLQAANSRLLQKRQELSGRTESTAAPSLVPLAFSKLKPIPNAQADELERKRDSEERLRKIAKLWTAANVPLRFREQAKKGFEDVAPWKSTLEILKNKIGTGFAAAIIGDRGTGKSQIAERLIRAAVAQEKSALYITAMGLFCEIKKSYGPIATLSEAGTISKFQAYKFLVIDEIGRRSANDWEDRILFEIIDGRYRELRDTLFLSNQDETVFAQSIGESIVSRINETGGIINARIADGWKCFRQ